MIKTASSEVYLFLFQLKMNRSEYQEECCGMKGKVKGGSGGSGESLGLTPCKYNEDIQPVGGRIQAKYRDEIKNKLEEIQEATLGGTGHR